MMKRKAELIKLFKWMHQCLFGTSLPDDVNMQYLIVALHVTWLSKMNRKPYFNGIEMCLCRVDNEYVYHLVEPDIIEQIRDRPIELDGKLCDLHDMEFLTRREINTVNALMEDLKGVDVQDYLFSMIPESMLALQISGRVNLRNLCHEIQTHDGVPIDYLSFVEDIGLAEDFARARSSHS